MLSVLCQSVVAKKAKHLGSGADSMGVGVASRCVAARPRMPGTMQHPVFCHHGAWGGVARQRMHGAGVAPAPG